MNPLESTLEIFAGATTPTDVAAALARAQQQAGMAAGIATSSSSVAEEAVARFLAHRAPLILRGGARTLLREALSEPAGSLVRRMAEEARASGARRGAELGVRLVRRDELLPAPFQIPSPEAARQAILVGDFVVQSVVAPGPPQLRMLRGDELLDVIELEAHCAGLCALSDRSLAVADADGHVSFWELLL